jgi:hypothetical protein
MPSASNFRLAIAFSSGTLFGWIVAGMIAAGSPLAWTLMGHATSAGTLLIGGF